MKYYVIFNWIYWNLVFVKDLVTFQVYEAMIEDKGKNFVFLRLSSTCVSDLKLTCDEDFVAQVLSQSHSIVHKMVTVNPRDNG